MKNLLIATDFSGNANHAAEYGYEIACQLKVNIDLFNAFIVPVEIPQASVSVWPPYNYEELLHDCKTNLKEMAEVLGKKSLHAGFKPQIAYSCNVGTVPEVINEKIDEEGISLIIMGTHGSNPWNGLLFGNHSRKMIDNVQCPLLLVPPKSAIGPVKKIAFATDFQELQKDTEAIYGIVPILRALNAELLITHIYNEKGHSDEFEKQVEHFLAEMSAKANYPKISYRIVKNEKAEAGLDWLCRFEKVDILAMLHREHSFLDRTLNGSHTQKMAGHISVPLLVIPGH